jgi:hypothetical protein
MLPRDSRHERAFRAVEARRPDRLGRACGRVGDRDDSGGRSLVVAHRLRVGYAGTPRGNGLGQGNGPAAVAPEATGLHFAVQHAHPGARYGHGEMIMYAFAQVSGVRVGELSSEVAFEKGL